MSDALLYERRVKNSFYCQHFQMARITLCKPQYSGCRKERNAYGLRKEIRNMKKVISLILVLVLALVVFSSCVRKEAAKEETAKMSFTIVNKTGENVTDLSLKERIGSKKQALDNGKLADGQEITVTGEIAVDNGAPSLDFTYALESGNSMMTTITTKGDKIITLKVDADGSPVADIAEK